MAPTRRQIFLAKNTLLSGTSETSSYIDDRYHLYVLFEHIILFMHPGKIYGKHFEGDIAIKNPERWE